MVYIVVTITAYVVLRGDKDQSEWLWHARLLAVWLVIVAIFETSAFSVITSPLDAITVRLCADDCFLVFLILCRCQP